jgi:CII-binding regulator of phage lambda lysogenization HflD
MNTLDNSNLMLLVDPEKYAKTAIEVLESQLQNAKSKNKIQKLKLRIQKWKKTLEVIGEPSQEKLEELAKLDTEQPLDNQQKES